MPATLTENGNVISNGFVGKKNADKHLKHNCMSKRPARIKIEGKFLCHLFMSLRV